MASKNLPSATYKFWDDVKQVSSNRYYYRIEQVSKTGEKFYSSVILFKKEVKPLVKLRIYPNPMRSYFIIEVNSLIRQPASMVVVDMSGKMVEQRLVQLEKGQNKVEYRNVSHLAKGTYLVKIITVDNTYVEKIVKE